MFIMYVSSDTPAVNAFVAVGNSKWQQQQGWVTGATGTMGKRATIKQ